IEEVLRSSEDSLRNGVVMVMPSSTVTPWPAPGICWALAAPVRISVSTPVTEIRFCMSILADCCGAHFLAPGFTENRKRVVTDSWYGSRIHCGPRHAATFCFQMSPLRQAAPEHPSCPDMGDRNGRSPGFRIIATTPLPGLSASGAWGAAHRLQLRGQLRI